MPIIRFGQPFNRALAILILWAMTAAVRAELTDDSLSWSLVKDKEGVRLYTRDEPGSDFEAFRAEITLNAPIEQVMAVMANPNSCVEWVHGCVVSYGFDEASFNHRYAYSVNNLPWPAKDRDYVLQIDTRGKKDDRVIVMDMRAADGKKAEDKTYTRVLKSHTIYRFTPTADGRTDMIWLQHTEPNGTLPSWLVNALVVDIPFNSLLRLQEVAQWEKYRGYTIVYGADGNIAGVARP